jgi:hypothetical protein
MKKFRFFAIISLIIIISLTGCSSNGNTSATNTATTHTNKSKNTFSNKPEHYEYHVIADKFFKRDNFPSIDDYISGYSFDFQGYLETNGIAYSYTWEYYYIFYDHYEFKFYTKNSTKNSIIEGRDMASGIEYKYHAIEHGNKEIWRTVNNGQEMRDSMIVRLQDLIYGLKYDKQFTMGYYLT